MRRIISRQSGFTLIEIAIALVIITVLLGYTVAMFPVQQELKQYRDVDQEMEQIIDDLIGYAQVNGRLPCADADNDGLEDWAGVGNDCTSWFGNVPARTIGYDGNYSAGGVLIDPWGSAYRYQVSAIDSGVPADTFGDFITPNGIRNAGIAQFDQFTVGATPPDLQVCNVQPAAHSAATPTDELVCDANTDVVTNVAAVVLSLGKDKDNVIANTSDIQSENLDNSVTDTVFIASTRNDSAGNEYDDVVKWISTSKLFGRMIAAEQLP
ncbi:MAG: type II secretion system protein [Pseudomonadota bacterium]